MVIIRLSVNLNLGNPTRYSALTKGLNIDLASQHILTTDKPTWKLKERQLSFSGRQGA